MADTERRREELRRCLKKLSNGRGVQSSNLRKLLRGDLQTLQEAWGVNLDNDDSSVRSIVVDNLFGQLKRVHARTEKKLLTKPAAVNRYKTAVAVMFNIAAAPVPTDEKEGRKVRIADLSNMILSARQEWMNDPNPATYRPDSFHVRARTARRYLDDAIGQIVDQLMSSDDKPVINDHQESPPDPVASRPAESPPILSDTFVDTLSAPLAPEDTEEAAPPTTPTSPQPPPAVLPVPTVDHSAPVSEPALQAQTFRNKRAARIGMQERFDLEDKRNDVTYRTVGVYQQIDQAILSAGRQGGFGRKLQRRAAVQLAGTSTGYKGLYNLHQTIFGIAGTDRVQASSLFSAAAVAAERSGRYDLAPDHERQMELYDALCADTQREIIDYHITQAYVAVVKRLIPPRLISGRPRCVENLAYALHFALIVAKTVAFDANAGYRTEPDGKMVILQHEASEESGRLVAIIERWQAAAPHAPPEIARILREKLFELTEELRAKIKEDVTESVPMLFHYGGKSTYFHVPNPSYNVDTRRGYLEQMRMLGVDDQMPV